jgi:WD40 repeat protein
VKIRLAAITLVLTSVLATQGAAQTKPDDSAFLLYRASIAAAEKALRLNETREAIDWLEQSPASERGWEWGYLRSLCDQSIGKTPLSGDATAIDISPAGDKAAIAFTDGTLRLCSLPDLKTIQTTKTHGDAIYSVDFSSDGKKLVTVSRDVTCRVSNVADGAEISQIKLDNPGVAAAAFSPDGSRVATCSWMMVQENGQRAVSGVVWIWDAQLGEVLHKSRVGVKPLDSIDWADDGSAIYVGSWDGLVHRLDLEGKETKQYRVLDDSGIYTAVITVDVSANGKWIACGTKDRTIRIWDSESGEAVATLAGHGGFVNEVRFRTNDSLISTSVDGMLRVWDWRSMKCERLLRGHEGSIPAAAISPDGQSIFSVGRDRTLRQWDLLTKHARPMQSRLEAEGCYTTEYSNDGKRIYVACYDGHLRVIDAQSGDTVEKWQVHNGSCNTLSLSADKQRLLTCSWDKTAKLLNANTGEQIANLDLGVGAYDCCLSPDGKLGAFAVGKAVEIWDLNSRSKLGVCTGFNGESLREVQFSPDGKSVAATGAGGNACVWDMESRKLRATLGNAEQKASTLCFSKDGKKIATAGTGFATLWQNEDGFAELGSVSIGDRQASNLSFSPDGTRLAVASDAIYLIDVARIASILRFQPNNDDVYYLAYSPDGTSLASCTANNSFAVSKSEPKTAEKANRP